MKSQIVKPIKSINLSIKILHNLNYPLIIPLFQKNILIQFAENCQQIILS